LDLSSDTLTRIFNRNALNQYKYSFYLPSSDTLTKFFNGNALLSFGSNYDFLFYFMDFNIQVEWGVAEERVLNIKN